MQQVVGNLMNVFDRFYRRQTREPNRNLAYERQLGHIRPQDAIEADQQG